MSTPVIPAFGVLTHSMHRPDHDPTLQLEQDIALAEHADRLGLAEFWWCERHTGGWQGVADPLLMAARAAATTHRIRLGAAVSPAHHHPVTLVDSALQLDHLTRGRFALGLATDVIDDDAEGLGLTGAEAELVIADAVEAAATLLRDRTPALQPYRGTLDVRTVSIGPSDGPDLAGRLGLGLVSTGDSAAPGQESGMARTWERVEAAAARARLRISRDRWAALTPIHVAASEVEARRQVRHGMAAWAFYARSAMPVDVPQGTDPDALVDALHAAGRTVVGTPAMAVRHIERLLDLSGGVGTILVEVAGWADAEHTRASLELLAREVIPQITGSNRSRLVAAGRPRAGTHPGGRRVAASTAAVTPGRGIGRAAIPPVTDGITHPASIPPSRRGRHAGPAPETR